VTSSHSLGPTVLLSGSEGSRGLVYADEGTSATSANVYGSCYFLLQPTEDEEFDANPRPQ
jgi:hypothetical protein